MAVDLHTHSGFSDGSDSPTELVAKAARLGLEAIALTDHDTLEGIDQAAKAAAGHGVELIPGTEISCEWTPGTLHMVVLFLQQEPGPLQDRLAGLQAARRRRNHTMVDRLQELGLEISHDEVLAEAGEGSVGRPHFAAVMVRKGYVPDIATAFDQYLAKGRPAYVPRDRLAPEEAIGLARAAGAVPVVAHPHTMGLDTAADYAEVFERLQAAGLVGVECFYSEYEPDRQALYVDLAARFGLLPSGGSDYHGTYKQGIELGTGRGRLRVPYSVLEDLRAARE